MRHVIYTTLISIDGYIAGPNGELDWVNIDEELHTFINDQQREIGAYIHGRRMYEIMADFWPTADADPAAPNYIVEFSRIWKAMPKIVFSTTLERVDWNASLVRDDVAGEIARQKTHPGKDLALGGANLAATFMRLGLIDEYRLFVQPVVLGNGRLLFPTLDDRINLRLADTRTFGSGVVYLRYLRANEG